MLPSPTLPATWRGLLEMFRPAFRRSRTFGLFVLLATGLVAQAARRTVVGMLVGAGVAAVVSFHACCRFFSHHRWDVDRIGLVLARLIVDRLVDAGAPIVVVVDDTLFRRWGPTVFGAFWTHDGSGQDPNALGRGNRWVIAGILVRLPFCAHPVCLPVLLRLWRGRGTASPVQLARELILLIAQEFRTGLSTRSATPPTTARRCWSSAPPSPPGCRPTPRCTHPPHPAPANAAAPG